MSYTYPDTKLLIDGVWRASENGRSLDVIDPAREEKIGTVAYASKADLEAAAQAVDRGFEIWKNVSVFERYKIMRQAADLLRDRAEEIAWIMTCEQGKPQAQSRIEIVNAADVIDWFAEEARRTYGQTIPARTGDVLQYSVKLPVGPVAAFTPWNFPINQVVRKLSGALAAGCSIVVKAPEETPASPAALIQCFIDAGVPAGVIALVYGDPAEISNFFITHPLIEKISFTGSTVVGKQLAALAGQHMKKSTMELGGHAPVMIFDDADIEKTAALMVASKYRNCGQVCVSPTRFLVQESVYERFVTLFTEGAKKLKVGHGLEADSEVGPLANGRRIPAIEALISDAITQGANLRCGNERVGNKGYFFAPTVLSDVPLSARIMNEEPFGPVAIINPFKTADDVIEEANRLRYGLASYAFTRSTTLAHRLAMEVKAGMTTINHIGLALPEVPFGGIKDSGYGTEGGSEAINAYLETKFITMAT